MKLAEILEVSVSRLCGSEDDMIKVNVLGNVAAGKPIDAIENIIGYKYRKEEFLTSEEKMDYSYLHTVAIDFL